ncbi:MAG: hypothetical protein RMJ33_08845 [Saprospiraceae bacterium]|nr:hypothetical protein [Saprospiraceae bacterium]MDW8229930.1 hypothetical protein [Saprospiraceae bacterium]
MLLDFFQPNTRYRVVRTFDKALAGEELAFVGALHDHDRYMGYNYHLLTFAEKDVRVDDIEADAEMLQFPERFFLPLGPADPADVALQLEARREREDAERAERSRRETLELARRKLEKRQKKQPPQKRD